MFVASIVGIDADESPLDPETFIGFGATERDAVVDALSEITGMIHEEVDKNIHKDGMFKFKKGFNGARLNWNDHRDTFLHHPFRFRCMSARHFYVKTEEFP